MSNSTSSHDNNHIVVLKMHGYIARVMAQQLEKILDTALADNCFQIIVDLSEADYLSSSGWGMFIGELKRVRDSGGDLILACMQPNVFEVFQLLEFHRVIRYFESVEQASQAFESAGFTSPN